MEWELRTGVSLAICCEERPRAAPVQPSVKESLDVPSLCQYLPISVSMTFTRGKILSALCVQLEDRVCVLFYTLNKCLTNGFFNECLAFERRTNI